MMLVERPRRLRASSTIRNMVAQTKIDVSKLILPMFVCDGERVRRPSALMPDVSTCSMDVLVNDVLRAHDAGIRAILLFPQISAVTKDADGTASLDEHGLIPRTIRAIKSVLPEILVMTDVALDPYTTHGHDGLVRDGLVVNDATVDVLQRMSVVHAEAGADVVAPSDMMDGRVSAIRTALDAEGHANVLIMSYTAKYASSLYGPFRDVLGSAPAHGDKRTYQMDVADRRGAQREARLDSAEGADIVMVKPGTWYGDIISDVRRATDVPVAAYQVSGEYAMLHAAARAGFMDFDAALLEALQCMHRAGADIIATYGAMRIAALGSDA